MTSARVVALALVVAAGTATAANAQAPWPNSQSQPQGQSAWPSSTPQPQPQQAPWPNSAPQGQPVAAPPMGGGFGGPPAGGGFGGPPAGGGFGGGPPPAVMQECSTQFQSLRSEVEKRGMAAKAGGEKQVAREEMCKLVTAYSAAEAKWVKFAEVSMTKCGIPKEIVAQLKTVHNKTAEGQKKLCAAGPAGGVAAAPTLSDALGTATLPTREPEKQRKPGGTLDTLTGNALGQ